ncbi:MAG: hypothetical protein WCF16_08255, partial [Alphaproteobacteria bacterium]
PDLTGKWHGHHYAVTVSEGYVDRENTITVTEQKGNRFTGTVEHGGVSENFIGIIRNNNRTFYWVDTKDSGIVQGEVIRSGIIETCYLEAGANGVAGCTVLVREQR